MYLPGDDDYSAPSVPALTEKGFVRWQGIQLLLEPQVHVPVLQFAVRNWALKHPDTGVPFPADLPSSALPTETDIECDKWHQSCAVKLREEATPKEEPKPTFTDRVPPGVAHVRPNPTPRDYFSNRPGAAAYVHLPDQYARRGGPVRRSSERERVDLERDRDCGRYGRRQNSSPDEPSGPRRRSVSDNPPYREVHTIPILRTGSDREPVARRHSQPRADRVDRKYSTGSSTSTIEEHDVTPHSRRRTARHPDDPIAIPIRRGYGAESGVRVVPGSPRLHAHGAPPPVIVDDGGRGHRRPSEEHSRRKSLHDFKERISSIFPGERRRSGSRTPKDDRAAPPGYSKLHRAWSMEDETDSARSDREAERRRRLERERQREREGRRSSERERERDRERRRADSDRERERERRRLAEHEIHDSDRHRRRRHAYSDEDDDDDDISPRSSRVGNRSRGSVHHHHPNDPYLAHPEVQRRTSSHADIDRRRDWDGPPSSRERRENLSRSGGRLYGEIVEPDLRSRERDRDRDRDRERDRDRAGEERWRPRDREQRERDDRMPSPVVTGVSGRKYPDPPTVFRG